MRGGKGAWEERHAVAHTCPEARILPLLLACCRRLQQRRKRDEAAALGWCCSRGWVVAPRSTRRRPLRPLRRCGGGNIARRGGNCGWLHGGGIASQRHPAAAPHGGCLLLLLKASKAACLLVARRCRAAGGPSIRHGRLCAACSGAGSPSASWAAQRCVGASHPGVRSALQVGQPPLQRVLRCGRGAGAGGCGAASQGLQRPPSLLGCLPGQELVCGA
jgi:hypothetical protein